MCVCGGESPHMPHFYRKGELMSEKEQIKSAVEEAAKSVAKQKEDDEKKSDEAILFAETTVGKFTVKPWTLGKLLKINPSIERIFQKLEEKRIKLSLENFQDFVIDVYFAAFPELVTIIAISLGKEEEDLYELQLSDLIKVVYVIYKQNEDSLKNVLSLLLPKIPQPQG